MLTVTMPNITPTMITGPESIVCTNQWPKNHRVLKVRNQRASSAPNGSRPKNPKAHIMPWATTMLSCFFCVELPLLPDEEVGIVEVLVRGIVRLRLNVPASVCSWIVAEGEELSGDAVANAHMIAWASVDATEGMV